MTAFAKTASTVEELEKELQAVQASPARQKIAVDSIAQRIEELRATVDKFVRNASETDPDKKLYGAQPVTSRCLWLVPRSEEGATLASCRPTDVRV